MCTNIYGILNSECIYSVPFVFHRNNNNNLTVYPPAFDLDNILSGFIPIIIMYMV